MTKNSHRFTATSTTCSMLRCVYVLRFLTMDIQQTQYPCRFLASYSRERQSSVATSFETDAYIACTTRYGVVVVAVVTLTGMIKSVVTGQAPVTLE